MFTLQVETAMITCLSPWSGYHEDPAVLVGGNGRYFPTQYQNGCSTNEIADFDASEITLLS